MPPQNTCGCPIAQSSVLETRKAPLDNMRIRVRKCKLCASEYLTREARHEGPEMEAALTHARKMR